MLAFFSLDLGGGKDGKKHERDEKDVKEGGERDGERGGMREGIRERGEKGNYSQNGGEISHT